MHEGKCQTAARKKRKTLYPHIFLLTEGRLGCVVFALFPIWFLLMEVKSLALGGFNFADLLGIVVSSAVIAATFFYFIPHYWPLCFGKLTLTENYVKWHGLFIRSVKIPYSELRHVEIRQFREGNVMRNADLYRTGQEYVLMSVDSLPKTRIDKIQKPTHVRRRSGRATGRNGKPSAKRHAKSAGKSGGQKSKKSMDRSGRCSSTARALVCKTPPAGRACRRVSISGFTCGRER